jgi:hypothetical protein
MWHAMTVDTYQKARREGKSARDATRAASDKHDDPPPESSDPNPAEAFGRMMQVLIFLSMS